MKFGLIGALFSFWRLHFLKVMRLFLLPMIFVQFLVTQMFQLKPLVETPEDFGITGFVGNLAVWTALTAVIITIATVTTWYGVDFFRTMILNEQRTGWFPRFKFGQIMLFWFSFIFSKLFGFLLGLIPVLIIASLATFEFFIYPLRKIAELFPGDSGADIVSNAVSQPWIIVVYYLNFRIAASLLPAIATGRGRYWYNFKKITKGYNFQILSLIILWKLTDLTIDNYLYEIPNALLHVYDVLYMLIPASLIVILFQRNVLQNEHYPNHKKPKLRDEVSG
jgi:hypothetical protein